jgi:predicted nucleic acid-binding protein
VEPVNLQQQVCRDPDDDKFISCAISGKAEVIVSGDKDLLSVSGITGMKVLRPIEFKKSYLNLS